MQFAFARTAQQGVPSQGSCADMMGVCAEYVKKEGSE